MALSLVCLGRPAAANGGDGPKPALDQALVKRARAAYDAGAKAYEAGRYEEALHDFQQAHAYLHKPEFYFNMARCAENLGRYAAADMLLAQYLLERPDAEDRAAIEARRQALAARMQSSANSTERLAHAVPLVEATGPRSLEASAIEGPVADEPYEAPPPPPRKRVATWILAGATGALSVAAVGLGASTLSLHDGLRDGCGATLASGCSSAELSGLGSRALATDVVIGLAVVAAAATVAAYFLEPRWQRLGHGARADSAARAFSRVSLDGKMRF